MAKRTERTRAARHDDEPRRTCCRADLATTHASDATPDTGGGGGVHAKMVEGFYVHSVAALAEVAALNAFTVGVLSRDRHVLGLPTRAGR